MAHDHHGHGHDDDHGHSHAGHSHAPASFGTAFAVGVALNIGFVAIEAVYGVLADSVALLADAGHNLGDVLGLLLAWAAVWLARRQPSRRHTYGLRRSTVLASLANAVALLVGAGALGWEALSRFAAPRPAEAETVMIVAAIGIVINTATALMFARGRKDDLNVRGAYLHMMADAAVSAGVVVAAFGMLMTGWLWLDPAISLVIVVVIAVSTWGLLRDSLNLALDAVPAGIDAHAVEEYLTGLPGVSAVHDLHIWAMSTTETALTAHLVRPDHGPDDALMARIADELQHRFRIGHATIQVESGNGEICRLAAPGTV